MTLIIQTSKMRSRSSHDKILKESEICKGLLEKKLLLC